MLHTSMLRSIVSLCLAASLLPVALPATAAGNRDDDRRSQAILGWVEWVDVGLQPLRLKAKLDTGATTSSITAKDVELFEKDGKRHVRFVIHDESRDVQQPLEARLVRHVRIRRHDGSTQRRPVVALDMCVGPVLRREEFTLIDRSSFVYPVLVGRNYMKDHIVVDPGSTFVQHPECERDNDRRNSADADSDADATATGARTA